jgi:peptide/nickel transport system permease protein
MFKHLLKNAMIPIITQVVVVIPFLFLGSLLLERFFSIPGLGYMLIDAVNSSDWPVINALTFVGAIIYLGALLLTDLCYALVDPRVSLK